MVTLEDLSTIREILTIIGELEKKLYIYSNEDYLIDEKFRKTPIPKDIDDIDKLLIAIRNCAMYRKLLANALKLKKEHMESTIKEYDLTVELVKKLNDLIEPMGVEDVLGTNAGDDEEDK